MDATIQALVVISLFAAVHERVIEAFRGVMLDGVIGKRFASRTDYASNVGCYAASDILDGDTRRSSRLPNSCFVWEWPQRSHRLHPG